AIEVYYRAVDLNPKNVDLRAELGSILHRARMFDEAANAFRAALELKWDAAELHVNLGFLLNQMGDVPGSIREFETAVKLTPDLPEAYYFLGLGRMSTNDFGGRSEE